MNHRIFLTILISLDLFLTSCGGVDENEPENKRTLESYNKYVVTTTEGNNAPATSRDDDNPSNKCTTRSSKDNMGDVVVIECADGSSVTIYHSEIKEITVIKEGTPGPKGDKGDRGEDGIDGRNGTNGADGSDGKDAEPCTVYETSSSTARIECPDGSYVDFQTKVTKGKGK